MGAAALAGRPGVLAVKMVSEGFREVDRVTCDPAEVTVRKMEEWLKDAGTYVRTLRQAGAERPPQDKRR